ncbi:MAG: cation diffusion facilitator family transporter [Candidatus Omnitrophota bacterium]
MNLNFKKIRQVLIFVMFLNWAVALAKIAYGLTTKCASMTADGFHSFSDSCSNIVGLIGIWYASRPIDKEHSYGHKKYETFSSIIIALILFIIAFDILKSGIVRFFHPIVPQVTILSFVIMVITVAVNSWVVFYERKSAKQFKSDILAADAMHTLSDVLVSISVIFTLLAVKSGFPMIDTIVAMFIAIFIGYSAFNILKDASDVLCDRESGVSDEIRKVVMNVSGVKDCHRIRTRGRADDVYVDLHVEVAPSMNVADAHKLTDIIENIIKEKFEGINDVVVHIEPES